MATADSIFKFCKKCQSETDRGSAGQCKPCAKANSSAWRAANSDRHLAGKAAYRAANLDKVTAYRAANLETDKARRSAWNAANPERAKAASAAWKAANTERKRATDAVWKSANPESTRISGQNYRAKKRENGGVLSKGLSAKLFKLQKGKCPCCKQPLGNNFHLDHIIPIALGGSNADSNIQLLRQRCNNQKSAKHPIEFMRSRGFLL